MPVEDTAAAVTADSAEAMAGTAADMPRQPMPGADTLVFAVGMAATLPGMREAMRAMLEARVTGPAVVTGEAITGEATDGGVITGEVIMDIRTMDIPGMDWATAIRITGMAITDIVRGGGTILTDTDTRPT